MTTYEIVIGNDEIAKMLGWEPVSRYCYKVPNAFPSTEDYGYTHLNTEGILFHLSWDQLIGAYNVALQKLRGNDEVQKRLKRQEHFIEAFAIKNFFVLFEGQLHRSSSWYKLVDFCKLYNSVK